MRYLADDLLRELTIQVNEWVFINNPHDKMNWKVVDDWFDLRRGEVPLAIFQTLRKEMGIQQDAPYRAQPFQIIDWPER